MAPSIHIEVPPEQEVKPEKKSEEQVKETRKAPETQAKMVLPARPFEGRSNPRCWNITE